MHISCLEEVSVRLSHCQASVSESCSSLIKDSMMNLLYILLLVLWSAFNSSDAWYLNYSMTEPPLATAQPSLTALPTIASQMQTRPTITSTSQQNETRPTITSIPHYQTQTRPNITSTSHQNENAPVPNITVFRQMQDGEHVMVMCSFGRRFIESSFQLSVEGEHSYTLKNPLCYSNEKCVFDVKVSSSVSFTCVHEINYVLNHHSETYTYSPSAQPSNMRTPYYKTLKAQNPITSTPCYKTQKAQNPITCTPCFKTQKAQNPITCTPCYKTQMFLQHEEGVSSFYIGFFSFIVVGLVIMTAAVIMTTLKSNTKGSVITETENDYTNV
ncbi:uncharacterized protein LOC125280103 [Megalobrama amblycephala]|uniref:uncharacterized protein LOC125280103 n=1 Tax=Megalobrama amblycephala TaxID=75352 RepID=UPI0020142401|nr:uncharacterized protein LOC125280103 [Megalobrama amblycephala]